MNWKKDKRWADQFMPEIRTIKVDADIADAADRFVGAEETLAVK